VKLKAIKSIHDIANSTVTQDTKKEKSSMFKLDALSCEVDQTKTKKLVLNPPRKKPNFSQQIAAGPGRSVAAEQEQSAGDGSSRYIHSVSCPSST
jgi:hypothetical protein